MGSNTEYCQWHLILQFNFYNILCSPNPTIQHQSRAITLAPDGMYMYLTVILPPTPFTGCSLSCVRPWTFPVPDNTRSQSTWPGTGGKWSLKTLMRSRISEASLQNGGHVCARQSHGVHVGELKGKKRSIIGMTLVFSKNYQYMYMYFHFDTDTLIKQLCISLKE